MKEIYFDRAGLKELIPHRDPMLLLDSMTVIEAGEARGTYHVRGEEFFLQGHYPGNPIVPGNILSEMLAQLGAGLVGYGCSRPDAPYANLRRGKTPILAGLDGFRFKSPVRPGDTVDLHIILTKDSGLVVTGDAEGRIGGQLAVFGGITVAFL